MSKRTVCVVIANRANYGRIKSALRAIQQHPQLNLKLIACSSAVLSHYGDASSIIEQDGFEIHARLFSALEGNTPATMAKSVGLSIIELTTQFEHLRPDVVVTIADRYEMLAVATSAAYMNIPVAHTQGGEITGSIDERVRHAVTKLADLHFPATHLSCEHLVRMGERADFVWMVGCPSIDLVVETSLDIDGLDLPARYGGIGVPLDVGDPFLLVLQHPVTNEYRAGQDQIKETLHALDRLAMPTLMLWPNIDAGSDEVSRGIRHFREQCNPSWLYLLRNVTPEDYVRLLNRASVIVGNSSSGLREGGFLGIPCVNIGTRQQGRERDKNVLDVDYDRDAIYSAIQTQLRAGRYPPSSRFGDGNAGNRIADVLANADLTAIRAQKRLHYL
jgi:UDP-hydrolysing UDP-N-acetyl-D-glucosamine 2-epimerase